MLNTREHTTETTCEYDEQGKMTKKTVVETGTIVGNLLCHVIRKN